MSKAPKTEPYNKPDILHLLEYCRIDRAAELLGCEVSDLLHLEEVSEISLYWKFDGQPAIARVMDVFPNTDERPKSSKYSLITVHFDDLGDVSEGAENQKIKLYGLWNAENRNTGGYDSLRPVRISCRACAKKEDADSFTAHLPLDWQEPPTTELYVKQDDLYRLRKAIMTGEPLQPDPDLPSNEEKKICQIEGRQVIKLTNKQCRAIMGALLLAGLSEDDLKGAPGELQDKVMNLAKHKGIKDPRIKDIYGCDIDTMAVWMERGKPYA
ncbi:hypothetical protein GL272_21085 [Aeromonas veronii]|uniref:hypothetical protein n=1 Tax=Aeromonas veronii TaxID=654 RepID=UPI001C5B2F24|nr:hypothetical protein [Aeromonas veronii]MBW3779369.1 hypothetical protein [Aeromonas veronii]